MWLIGKKKKTKTLGIDIGSKGVRIVELSQEQDRIVLENYGELKIDGANKETFKYFDKRTLQPSVKNVTLAIKGILREAQIETREAIFSLPDFATFFTSFTLPPMTAKEIEGAVNFEAKKHIPIPFEEVLLDWELIGGVNEKEGENKVLVMAISKSLIGEYKKIAEGCGIKLLSLEAEVMGLKRSVDREKKGIVCLVEIGYQSTTINIIEEGFLVDSVSFDVAGKDFTYAIADALNVDIKKAEEIKKKNGLDLKSSEEVKKALEPIFNIIVNKIKKVDQDFEEKKDQKIEKIILVGGSSNMPGIVDYFKVDFNGVEIKKGNAFEGVIYDSELKPILPELNATFSIALGEGLKRFEK